MTKAADLGDRKLVGLSPVDAYWDVSSGGAEFLVEPAVGADPQVILCDFHLEKQNKHTISLRGTRPSARTKSVFKLLTAQRKPEPGMESKPSSSLVMEIM